MVGLAGEVDFPGFVVSVGAVEGEADEGLTAVVDLVDAAETLDAVVDVEEGFCEAEGESGVELDVDDSPFAKRDTIDRKNFFTSHSAGRHRGSDTEA
ncbi:hypothetical protein CAURIM_04540 [Corynebacterium aurimucosum]|nr:hypothetical protein CAURIM_04540 [Corynebacterium aurimucosum]